MNTTLCFRRVAAYNFVITINTIIFIYMTSTQYVVKTYFKDMLSVCLVRRRCVLGCPWYVIRIMGHGYDFPMSSVISIVSPLWAPDFNGSLVKKIRAI